MPTATATRARPPKAATGATRRDAARALAKRALHGITGRPTMLTPSVEQALVEAISEGMPMTPAAWLAGVSPQAVSDWTTRGEAELAIGEESVYARFAYRLKQAEGASVRACLKGEQTAPNDWQRWAWMLERRWPEWFGRRDALAVAMQGDVRITVEHVADWHARDVIDVTPEPQREPQKRGRKREAKAAAD